MGKGKRAKDGMEACQGNGKENSKRKTHAVSEMEESGEKATIQSQVG